MFSIFIESLLPFWSTTVITFGSSSVVGLAFISNPGVRVVFCFLSLISFLRPLPYAGLIVVFSISSVLSSTFSSSIGVLHLSECSAVSFGSSVSSSNCPCCRNRPSFPLGFSPVVIMGSEILGPVVCLFVLVELFCFYQVLLCVLFRLPRFVVYFRMRFRIFLYCFFSKNRYGNLLLTSSFSFLGAFITNWW